MGDESPCAAPDLQDQPGRGGDSFEQHLESQQLPRGSGASRQRAKSHQHHVCVGQESLEELLVPVYP